MITAIRPPIITTAGIDTANAMIVLAGKSVVCFEVSAALLVAFTTGWLLEL
mgnify:CR=1